MKTPKASFTASNTRQRGNLIRDMSNLYVNNYKRAHPIRQSKHNGLYGFRRHGGVIDLTGCVHKTKREAEIAREESAICFASDMIREP